jgi:hypothetical protein
VNACLEKSDPPEMFIDKIEQLLGSADSAAA